MSCAIIRNAKIKASSANNICRHNERQKEVYKSNPDVDTSRSDLNYHIKEPVEKSYTREFDRLKAENCLVGQVHPQSNILCEFVVTSDSAFFEGMPANEMKDFFKDAYDFAAKMCRGEKNIVSAVVHLDETTPHMHLVYIPVVAGKDKKGNVLEKVRCTDFWKGWNSYGTLQDNYWKHMHDLGWELERGIKSDRQHLTVQEYKRVCDIFKTEKKTLGNTPYAELSQHKTYLFKENSVEDGRMVLQSLCSHNIKCCGVLDGDGVVLTVPESAADAAHKISKLVHSLNEGLTETAKMIL